MTISTQGIAAAADTARKHTLRQSSASNSQQAFSSASRPDSRATSSNARTTTYASADHTLVATSSSTTKCKDSPRTTLKALETKVRHLTACHHPSSLQPPNCHRTTPRRSTYSPSAALSPSTTRPRTSTGTCCPRPRLAHR